MRYIFTAGFLAAAIAVSAQSPKQLDFGVGFPGDVRAMDVDGSGNTYVAGTFINTQNFGSNTFTSNGGYDVFVLILNPTGQVVAAQSFGGPNNDVVNAIDVDLEGLVYIAGNFSGEVDFDPTNGEWYVESFNGSTDGFLLKLNAELGLEFVVTVAGFEDDDVTGVTTYDEDNDNIYFTGNFNTDADINFFNSGSVGIAGDGQSAFMAKVDYHGQQKWQKVLSNDDFVTGTGAAVDFAGNPVFVGQYDGSVSLNPEGGGDVNSLGPRDIFILKMNSADGTYVWGKSIGGNGGDYDYARSVSTDGQNNIYVTGQFFGQGDFDPGAGTTTLIDQGYGDMFITKFNAAGALTWARAFGAEDIDLGYDVFATNTDVYITGQFFNEVDFGTSSSHIMQSYGPNLDISIDAFTLNLDNNGNFKWVGQMGGSSFDTGVEIAVYQSNVSAVGTFNSSDADVDPSCNNLNFGTGFAHSYVINIGTNDANCSTGDNQAPVIASAKASATVGQRLVFDLTPYLSDPDDNLDLSTLNVFQQPLSEAPAAIEGSSLIVDYTGLNFRGTDAVNVEVCDLEGSCAQRDIQIDVLESNSLVVYNAVSPNNDGKNDVFFIAFIDASADTKSNKVTIYNRWGDLVFEVDNYNNVDRVFKGLNKNGKELASGTYYYKIDFNGNRKTEAGYLALKR